MIGHDFSPEKPPFFQFSMKKFLLLMIGICAAPLIAKAQTPTQVSHSDIHTPIPAYPASALKAKITGRGICQITFDASGHAESVLMTRSTGSTVLDQNTLAFAQAHWTGNPNSVASVPVNYRLVHQSNQAQPTPVTVNAPKPPYPEEARRSHLTGKGLLKVSFDQRGKLTGVTMVKSTGFGILDENTIKAVKYAWSSSGGRAITIVVPFEYRLRP